MKFILLFTFLIIFSNAQSIDTKTNNINSNKIEKQDVESDIEDEFEDDFSDEFNEKEDKKISDPLETYNRAMFSLNDSLYINILNPVSKNYADFVPEGIRIGISNVFKNLYFPIRVSNNLLQGKFENSFDETSRFVINSTIGLLGIMDIADSYFDIKEHDEDFGQTLGYWGVDAGPHIVLPLLGPSNLRDSLGLIGSNYMDPTNNYGALKYKIPNTYLESLGLNTAYLFNKNSLNLGLYESLKKDSIDFYTFSRDFYENKRFNDIKE